MRRPADSGGGSSRTRIWRGWRRSSRSTRSADGLPISWVSPGFELLTGYSAAEVVGRNAKLLQGPDTDPRAISRPDRGDRGRPRRLRDAAELPRRRHAVLERGGDRARSATPTGAIVRWLGTQRDVTDRMRANARLHELAYFDALTGLANRSALHDELRSAMHRARVHETEIALLQVDVDDFRRVNERWGHQAGDALLRVVADRLRSVVRPQDLLARLGGDEFALLLKDLPGGESERVARELGARILTAVREEPHVVGDLRVETARLDRRRDLPPGHDDQRRRPAARRRRGGRVRQARRQGHAARAPHAVRRGRARARRRVRPARAAAGELDRILAAGAVTARLPADRRPGDRGGRWPTRRWRAGRRARRCTGPTGCSPPRAPRAGRSSWTGSAAWPRCAARWTPASAATRRCSSTASRSRSARRARPSTPTSGSAPRASSTWSSRSPSAR